MPALAPELRRQLENAVKAARGVAETAAVSALQWRGVDAAEPFDHFSEDDRRMRVRLRARAKTASEELIDKKYTIDRLSGELAYEYWHRMLFARFLAENGLLMHPDGVAVSLDECEQLAPEAEPPAANGYVLAARYAGTMLPEIFRTDDVLLEVEFAPEHRLELEKLLRGLTRQTFLADDALGWVYQFWQAEEKERVNRSGDKIDGRSLPAVTQLFTEHYMVEFLLHNTIGAWWCAQLGISGPPGGAGVPVGKAPVEMEYLRWRDDGSPAAGTFPGWPKRLAAFTLLDPCCGSGHFLGAAFNLLVPLRMHDEGLSPEAACDAVLRENLFGLELDPRCTQIAAFALALAAWKYPGAGGYRTLPTLNIACSGQGVAGKREEWLALANGDPLLRNGMDRLYDLFEKAPHLGSLIDPRRQDGDLFHSRYAELQELLKRAWQKYTGDDDLTAVGVAAQGIVRAAELLSKTYTLVATNVPYLGRGRQADVIKEHLETEFALGKADLATAFVQLSFEFLQAGGTTALVTPHNWLFLTTYKKLREELLQRREWNLLARLGPRAFETISGEVVNVALLVQSVRMPASDATMAGFDVSEARTPEEKAGSLAGREPGLLQLVRQADQLRNPDARLSFGPRSDHSLLEQYAICRLGLGTGDGPHYLRHFWEIPCVGRGWTLYQTPMTQDGNIGYDSIVAWDDSANKVRGMTAGERKQAHNQDYRGREVWGKPGVAVSLMTPIKCGPYTGEKFDKNVAVVVASDEANRAAVSAYVESADYAAAVSEIDPQLKVTNASLLKVPFDLAHWQVVAAEKYPDGLPEPHSDDPTQWLFKGDIATSIYPLQVAIARLLGYRWPDQPGVPDAVDMLTDADGIVCLPAVRQEKPAAERLLEVLHAAYGPAWTSSTLGTLLTAEGCKADMPLVEWVRDKFFEQHCKRFHQRPFVWHIWDGHKPDGFAALVNYHKLDRPTLEKLTYAYLQDWITAQTADAKAERPGAGLRLNAAQKLHAKLRLILSGEKPHDIFVRWKPLHEQPVGWTPDPNDGVRLNIRPFVIAAVLRKDLKGILKKQDRGNEPTRDKADYPWFWEGDTSTGVRVNDKHYSLAEKAAARKARKGAS